MNMLKKLLSMLLALMLLCTLSPVAVAEDTEWTEEELEYLDEMLDDNSTTSVLRDEFRYTVEDGDYSIAEGLDENVMNILLLGTDNAGTVGHGRTDSMIICSINTVTGEVKLSSIVRDLYVDIPYMQLKNRINAANAFGGPNMAIKCVNETFKLNISRYASINFAGFKDLVDLLGGVEIEITSGEASEINKHTTDMTPVKAGMAMLNGAQALEYCRIRKLDNNFGRNERQRKFLEVLVKKVLSENSLDQLLALVDTCMKYMSTNLTMSDLFTLVFSVVPNMGELQMYSCPAKGEYSYMDVRGMDVVVANSDKMVESLHAFIYGEQAE